MDASTPIREGRRAVKGIRARFVPASVNLPRAPNGDRGYALLVDADSQEPDIVPAVLSALLANGPVPIRRLHGNLLNEKLGKSWERLARRHGFDRRHRPKTRSTKNGADVALAVDAMDLLGEGYQYFCLIAGDTDFGALIERLHRGHCTTVIVSANPALHAWSAHAFTFDQIRSPTDARPMVEVAAARLEVKAKPAGIPTAKIAPVVPAPKPEPPSSGPNVEHLLKSALKHATAKGRASEGWVDENLVGPMFPLVDKTYSRKKYGLSNRATVRSMAAKFPQAFEITTKTIKEVRHTLIRIRT